MVGNYFEASDIVVLPYRKVSTSGVLKIAFAFKKPVMATSEGELPEMIRSNNAGFIVDYPLGTSDFQKIRAVFLGEEKYYDQNMKSDNYDWDTIGGRTKKLYANLRGVR